MPSARPHVWIVLLVALACGLTWVPASSAASVELIPNADKSVGAGWVGTGCSAPNTYQCIDETFAGHNDSDYVSGTTTTGGSAFYDVTTAPIGSANAIGLDVFAYKASAGFCLTTIYAKKANGTVLTSVNVGLSPSGVSVSPGSVGVSLTQSDIDGLYIDLSSGGGTCDAVFRQTSIVLSYTPPPNLGGFAADTSICNGSTPVIGVAVNATKFGDVPCTAGTGAFLSAASWNAGDIITVYYDGVTPKGAFVIRTVADNTVPISVTLQSGEVRAESLSGTALSAVDIGIYDSSKDPDIPLTWASPTLTTTATLAITAGNFAPATATTLNVDKIWIHTGATFTPPAGEALKIAGSGTGSCSDSSTGRPFCNVGTYVNGSSTVTYNSTAATVVTSGTFYQLTLAGSANYDLDAGNFAVTFWFVSGTANVSTTAYSPTMTLSSASIGGGSTFGGSGTGLISIPGNMSGAGTMNFTGSSVVELRSAGAAQTFSNNGAVWTFATLIMSTSSTARTITTAASQGINVTTLLQIGRSTDTAVTTFNASAMAVANPIIVSGNLDVQSMGSFTTPVQLTIQGNLTNTGTVTTTGSTIEFTGTGTSVVNMTTGTLATLKVTGFKTVSLATNITATNIAMSGAGGCGSLATLNSSVAGTARTVTSSGTFSATNSAFQDTSMSVAKTAASAQALGNTTNITFTSQPCGTVSGFADNIGICDGITPVVGIAVNTAKFSTVPCDVLTGFWSASPAYVATDTVTVYYDNVAGGAAASAGATWVKAAAASTASSLTNVQLNRQRYRTEARAAGTPITSTDIGKFANPKDSDIYLGTTGNDTVLDSAATFEVGINGFSPTTPIVTPKLWVRSGAAFTLGTTSLGIFGSGNGTCNDVANNNPLCIAGTGTFSGASGTVDYFGTGTTEVPPLAYGTLEFDAGTNVLGTGAAQTITATSLLLTATANVDTSTYSPTFTVSGAASIGAGTTLGGSGSGTTTIAGTFSGSGLVNFTGGTVDLRGSTSVNLNPLSVPWQFATLIFSSTTARAVTLIANSKEIDVSTLLQIGKIGDTVNTTLSAAGVGNVIVVAGNLTTIVTHGLFSPPPLLTVQGNLTNAGTFSSSSGLFTIQGNFTSSGTLVTTGSTIEFTGAATSTVNVTAGTITTLKVTGFKTVSLATNITATNISMTGAGGCGSLATLNSSAVGVARTITSTGTFTVTNGAFQDASMSVSKTATSAQNLGNNTNITYGTMPCGTVQGTTTDTSICDGATGVIGIAVNGAKSGADVPCTPGTGAWHANPAFVASNTVVAYFDAQTSKGVTYLKVGSANPISGVTLDPGVARVGTLYGTALALGDFLYDSADDPDIPLTVSGTTLTSTATMSVTDGVFSPTTATAFTVSRLWVHSATTFTSPTAMTLQVTGSGNGTCNNATQNRPICSMGAYTAPTTGSVTYAATSGPTSVNTGTYGPLIINGSANYDLDAGTLTSTSLTLGGSANVSTTANSPTVNVNGPVVVGGTSTLGGSGTGILTFVNDFTGSGTVNFTGGTVDMNGGAQTINNTANVWQFATLLINGTTNHVTAVTAGSKEIRTSGLFQVGRVTDTFPTSFVDSGAGNIMTNTGDVSIIASKGSMSAPPTWTVQGNVTNANTLNTAVASSNVIFQGNFTNTGTFTSTGSTVAFTGASPSTVSMTSGSFATMNITGAKTVSLATNITATNIGMTGVACGSLATLNSTAPGTARTITSTGTFSATAAAFQDDSFATAKTAGSSTNLGNNTNITYGSDPCGTITGTSSVTTFCNGVTPVIGIAINAVKFGDVPCTAGTGAFTAGPTWSAGDIVTVFYDGVSAKAALYTRTASTSSTPLTGVSLWSGEVHVRSLSGTAITAADMNQYDADNDPDIEAQYPVSGQLQVPASTGFVVDSGNFQPGVDVTAYRFWVPTAGTYTAGTNRMVVTASGSGTCSNATSARPFCMVGTFNTGTGTVSYQGTSNYEVSNGAYANLEVISGSSNTVQLGTSASGTITATSLLVNGTAGTPIVDTTSYSPTVNVSGATTVSGTATLGGSGTGTLTIGGDMTGDGQINFTAGTVELRNAGAAQQINASGTLPGTPWQFATLGASTSAGTRTVTTPATSRTFKVSVLLRLGNVSDTSTTQLTTTASTQTDIVTGNVNITTRGSLTPNYTFEVDGDFTHSGVLAGGVGAIEFGGTGTSTITSTGTGLFPRLQVISAPKTIAINGNISVNTLLSLSGSSCAAPVTFRSATAGVPATVTNTGTSMNSMYTSYQDIAFTQISATTGPIGDLGGNTNLPTVGGVYCASPTSGFFNSTNASAGSTHGSVNGNGPFHMSVVNSTGATVDRYRTDISTSVLDNTVVGLFPLDGSGSDRSTLSNTATASGGVSWSSGATNFGQAATFDGSTGMLSAPTNAAYDVSTFTVDFWAKASGYSTLNGTMVGRTSGATTPFAVYTNSATKTLRAQITANGGTAFAVTTPAAPWLDNTWHHYAMSVDSAKTIRLYVDGTQYGTPVTYTGTIDTGGALYFGGTGSANNWFNGQLDDVQFKSGSPNASAITGYAATKRPHAQSVWQSSGYGTTTGAALSGSCLAAARCADIVYGGPAIHLDGARYYASQQLRTASSGLWSYVFTDYFTTSDAISITGPSSIALPSSAPGNDVTGNAAETYTCGNATGCSLMLETPSDTIGLVGTAATNTIPLFPSGAPAAHSSGTVTGLGFGVLSSTSGKNTTTWGSGNSLADFSGMYYTGSGRTPTLLQQTSSSGTETTNIAARMNAPPGTAPDSYSGTVTITVLANP